MTFTEFLQRIESTAIATAVRESTWLFPTVETLHVIALVLVVGSIIMVDLRLLNIGSRDRAVSEVSAEVLPWTWAAFAGAVITGVLLFMSSAERYFENVPFRIKMLLLLAAGVNMAIFHALTYRSVASWDRASATPLGARLAGGISLALWVSIVFLGRWIGFV